MRRRRNPNSKALRHVSEHVIVPAGHKVGEAFGNVIGTALATAALVLIGEKIGRRWFSPPGPGKPPGSVS